MITPALEVNTATRKEIICELDPSVGIKPNETETLAEYRARHAAVYAEYLRTGNEGLLCLDGKESRFICRPLTRAELRHIELDCSHWLLKGGIAYTKATRERAFAVGCIEAFDVVDGERKTLDKSKIPYPVQEELGVLLWRWSTEVDGPFGARSSQSSGGEQAS